MNDKINSVNLFEDLKNTNLKMKDLKEILSSYKKLEATYIKNNEADLLKDLNKQKQVIFSYLGNCKEASLKKMASMANELQNEFGDFDEVDTFNTPDKNISLVNIAYENGKWIVSTKNLSDGLVIKDIPQGINNLVELVDRMDEQEAAYALCHAKTAGKFVLAALPYVRTDMPDTAWATRYMKEPTVPLGPYEKSEDSASTHNMPVSRQFASEEGDNTISIGDRIENEDGDLYEIIAVSGNEILTSKNEFIDRNLAEGKLEMGEWRKVESAKDDINPKDQLKIEKILHSIDDATDKMKEHQIKLLAIQQISKELTAKLVKLQEQTLKEEADFIKKMDPKIRRILKRIEEITFKNEDCIQKLKVLKIKFNGLNLQYNRGVENYRRTMVPVAEAEEILQEIRKYVSPRYIKEYEKLTEKLFKFVSRTENWAYSLDLQDPLVQKELSKQTDKLRNQKLSASLNNEYKDAAYDKLDNLLAKGAINFEQYNTLTDFAELDGKKVLSALEPVEACLNRKLKAGIVDNIKNIIKDAYYMVKDWIESTLPLFTIQEKQITDINEDLDKILED